MVYKVYLKHSTEIVEAMNYFMDTNFVIFYTISTCGDQINTYSYKSSDVCKIELFEQDLNEIRENKLKRILKKENFFKRFYKKYKK